MKEKRKSYYNENWYDFSNKVKRRDGYKCLKCGRSEPDVVLQTHYKLYRSGLEPWDYALSECLTLCKGCHARVHGLIEPETGWTLISIEDLGDLYGICERKGCGNEIRYEHVTYHPAWGYKTVGSTCVEHLTREDQYLSEEVLKLFKKIADFVNDSTWNNWFTKTGKDYQFAKHAHSQIRIYGEKNSYAFQVALKVKGEKWFEFRDVVRTPNKNLRQVKELAFITLKGLMTESKREKELLRNIYKSMI
jgi:hypothetical protein